MSPCPEKVDHIGLFLDSIRHNLSELVEQYALNAFRQCMDQHERRHILQSDLRNYFSCLLESIEFLHIYDICLFNADRLKDGEVMMSQTGQEDGENVVIPNTGVVREKFNWATIGSEEWKASKAEMVTCVFRDLKRFIASPLVKYILPFSKIAAVKSDNNNDNQQDRQLLLLSGILFPAFIGNRNALLALADGEEAVKANVVPQFSNTDHVMQMVTTTNIDVGQPLTTGMYNTIFY